MVTGPEKLLVSKPLRNPEPDGFSWLSPAGRGPSFDGTRSPVKAARGFLEPSSVGFRVVECASNASIARFLSSPFMIRVPFFLVFGFKQRGPQIRKGKAMLLRNLDKDSMFGFTGFGVLD